MTESARAAMKKNKVATSFRLSDDLASQLEVPRFRPIDRQLARFLIARCQADDATALAGAVTSCLLEKGHSCLPFDKLGEILWSDEDEGSRIELPPAAEWINILKTSPAVGEPGERAPLILDGNLLYLYKYHAFEEAIASRLHSMAAPIADVTIDAEVIKFARKIIKGKKDFSKTGGQLQMAGVFLPFFSNFSIITGGPGTGKTTVLAAMLALLCKDAELKHEALPTIRIAAPTGKAAQRMGDSIAKFLGKLPESEIRAHLKTIAPSTLHRLLGLYGDSPKPKHNAQLPVEADIVVVDEASMMDISMFARLIDALPPNAKLILLGDRHQLASVQAGCVLADICKAYVPNGFTDVFARTVNSAIVKPKNHIQPDCSRIVLSPVVELNYSFRFPGDEPIGLVSSAINDGKPDLAISLLKSEQSTSEHCRFSEKQTIKDIENEILKRYALLFKFTEATKTEDALTQLGKFMVLTVVNEGPFGRVGINERVRSMMGKELAVRPIKITENSPRHQLYNGDMGVIIRKKNAQHEVVERAWFPAAGESDASGPAPQTVDTTMLPGRRQFLVGALPAFVDAFAITIHNSQGSEYEDVMVVLPPDKKEGKTKTQELLTRELLYTAVTRAKEKVDIVGSEETVREAIERENMRHSGLEDRLRSK